MHRTSAAERRTATARILLLLFAFTTIADNAAAEAPAPLQQLIDAGNVTFEFYDPLRNRQRYPGRTEFLFYVDHQYRFQYETVEREAKSYLTIRLTMRKITCRVEHKMILPQRLNTDDRWNDRLLRHEFDHVAVSTDPRISLLAERLLRNIRRITVEIDPRARVDHQSIDRIVDEEIQRRREAVVASIQANYHRLDELTRHGAVPLADRQKFFGSRYTEENLKQADFPFVAEVADLLRSRIYRATLPRQVAEP